MPANGRRDLIRRLKFNQKETLPTTYLKNERNFEWIELASKHLY